MAEPKPGDHVRVTMKEGGVAEGGVRPDGTYTCWIDVQQGYATVEVLRPAESR